jgi:hypothetical protein
MNFRKPTHEELRVLGVLKDKSKITPEKNRLGMPIISIY